MTIPTESERTGRDAPESGLPLGGIALGRQIYARFAEHPGILASERIFRVATRAVEFGIERMQVPALTRAPEREAVARGWAPLEHVRTRRSYYVRGQAPTGGLVQGSTVGRTLSTQRELIGRVSGDEEDPHGDAVGLDGAAVSELPVDLSMLTAGAPESLAGAPQSGPPRTQDGLVRGLPPELASRAEEKQQPSKNRQAAGADTVALAAEARVVRETGAAIYRKEEASRASAGHEQGEPLGVAETGPGSHEGVGGFGDEVPHPRTEISPSATTGALAATAFASDAGSTFPSIIGRSLAHNALMDHGAEISHASAPGRSSSTSVGALRPLLQAAPEVSRSEMRTRTEGLVERAEEGDFVAAAKHTSSQPVLLREDMAMRQSLGQEVTHVSGTMQRVGVNGFGREPKSVQRRSTPASSQEHVGRVSVEREIVASEQVSGPGSAVGGETVSRMQTFGVAGEQVPALAARQVGGSGGQSIGMRAIHGSVTGQADGSENAVEGTKASPALPIAHSVLVPEVVHAQAPVGMRATHGSITEDAAGSKNAVEGAEVSSALPIARSGLVAEAVHTQASVEMRATHGVAAEQADMQDKIDGAKASPALPIARSVSMGEAAQAQALVGRRATHASVTVQSDAVDGAKTSSALLMARSVSVPEAKYAQAAVGMRATHGYLTGEVDGSDDPVEVAQASPVSPIARSISVSEAAHAPMSMPATHAGRLAAKLTSERERDSALDANTIAGPQQLLARASTDNRASALVVPASVREDISARAVATETGQVFERPIFSQTGHRAVSGPLQRSGTVNPSFLHASLKQGKLAEVTPALSRSTEGRRREQNQVRTLARSPVPNEAAGSVEMHGAGPATHRNDRRSSSDGSMVARASSLHAKAKTLALPAAAELASQPGIVLRRGVTSIVDSSTEGMLQAGATKQAFRSGQVDARSMLPGDGFSLPIQTAAAFQEPRRISHTYRALESFSGTPDMQGESHVVSTVRPFETLRPSLLTSFLHAEAGAQPTASGAAGSVSLTHVAAPKLQPVSVQRVGAPSSTGAAAGGSSTGGGLAGANLRQSPGGSAILSSKSAEAARTPNQAELNLLANRIYEMLVKRLASERQRRKA